MGAEAVKKLLQQIDLEELSAQLRAELKDASGQKKARIVKRWRWWTPSACPATSPSG